MPPKPAEKATKTQEVINSFKESMNDVTLGTSSIALQDYVTDHFLMVETRLDDMRNSIKDQQRMTMELTTEVKELTNQMGIILEGMLLERNTTRANQVELNKCQDTLTKHGHDLERITKQDEDMNVELTRATEDIKRLEKLIDENKAATSLLRAELAVSLTLNVRDEPSKLSPEPAKRMPTRRTRAVANSDFDDMQQDNESSRHMYDAMDFKPKSGMRTQRSRNLPAGIDDI